MQISDEHLLMVRLVIGSIPHGGTIETFLAPATAPQLMKQRMWDGVYKRSLVTLIKKKSLCSGGSGIYLSISEWSFTLFLMPLKNIFFLSFFLPSFNVL